MNISQLNITNHARMRWRQRFAARLPMGLEVEILNSKRWKRRKLIGIGIRCDSKFRYYVSGLCVFIVRADNKALITILARKR